MNRNEHNSGRRRTTRTAQNIAAVHRILLNNPKSTSVRRNVLQLPKSSFNKIVRLDLNFYPYHVQKVYELKLADYPRRVNFCNWFLQKCRSANFLNRLYIGDEASFTMNGDINTRNMH